MMDWIDRIRRVRELSQEASELRERCRDLLDANTKAEGELASLRMQTQTQVVTIEELRRKVRSQNEADLLFASLKTAKLLIDGEKKDSPEIMSLLSQQALYSSQLASYDIPAGLGGVFGGLFGQRAY